MGFSGRRSLGLAVMPVFSIVVTCRDWQILGWFWGFWGLRGGVSGSMVWSFFSVCLVNRGYLFIWPIYHNNFQIKAPKSSGIYALFNGSLARKSREYSARYKWVYTNLVFSGCCSLGVEIEVSHDFCYFRGQSYRNVLGTSRVLGFLASVTA